jgi:hypothetical protein
MFQPGFVEQDNNEVVLKDFDPDTLATLLEFMYTAKITISEDNAQDILIGKIEVTGLYLVCQKGFFCKKHHV